MWHGNITMIINKNGKFIGVKLSLARIATGVVCTSHECAVKRVVGVQTVVIIIDTR